MDTATEPPTKKARASCLSTDLKHGTIIQGGTKEGKAATDLRKALDASKATGRPWEKAFLFPNDKGEYDGTLFGATNTTDPNDFNEFAITPCDLPDPTIKDQWYMEEVKRFFNFCDQAWQSYKGEFTVAIACVGGNNRSKALAYAVTQDPAFKPTCPAIQAVAEAYINKKKPEDVTVPVYSSPVTGLRSRAMV